MDVVKFGHFPATELGDLYHRACNGNHHAQVFLSLWADVVHKIDDQIDEKITAPEFALRICVFLNLLYTTPFYQQHSGYLSMAVVLITNTYADSIMGEHSHEESDRKIADVIRFCGNDMVCAVAFLTGGWESMRNISMRLRQLSWIDHHSPNHKEE